MFVNEFANFTVGAHTLAFNGLIGSFTTFTEQLGDVFAKGGLGSGCGFGHILLLYIEICLLKLGSTHNIKLL